MPCLLSSSPSSLFSPSLSLSISKTICKDQAWSNKSHKPYTRNQTHILQTSMAVEAHHLNLFPSQFITNRDFMNTNQGNANIYNTQMDSVVGAPLFHHQSTVCDSFPAKTSVVMKKCDSGLTYNLPITPRKRSRDTFSEFNAFSTVPDQKNIINNFSDFSSVLGEDINLQIQIQQLEIDRIISQHTEKLKMEVEERRKRQSRMLVSAIEGGVIKKLKEKEEEVQRIGKINWVLQERVKTLFVENQLWRDLAQSNEATANTLRNNLEQVLAHVSEERLCNGGGAAAAADDAESCCDSNDCGREEEEEEEKAGRCKLGGEGLKDKVVLATVPGGGGNRMCKKCGERESCVLLLPCRHLCLCTSCGSTHYTCPVCNSNMTASLHVNMS